MLNTIPDKVLAKAIRTANWQAIKNPGMEYRVTLRGDDVSVTEWTSCSRGYIPGDIYIWTVSYSEDHGTPSHEQHAFIAQIPETIKEIREAYSKEDSFQ